MSRFARARKNKQLVAGSILATVIVVLAIVGPAVFGDYARQDLLLGH